MPCLLPQATWDAHAYAEGSLIQGSEAIMKSIILWLCGVPLVAIIALKIFGRL